MTRSAVGKQALYNTVYEYYHGATGSSLASCGTSGSLQKPLLQPTDTVGKPCFRYAYTYPKAGAAPAVLLPALYFTTSSKNVRYTILSVMNVLSININTTEVHSLL